MIKNGIYHITSDVSIYLHYGFQLGRTYGMTMYMHYRGKSVGFCHNSYNSTPIEHVCPKIVREDLIRMFNICVVRAKIKSGRDLDLGYDRAVKALGWE